MKYNYRKDYSQKILAKDKDYNLRNQIYEY